MAIKFIVINTANTTLSGSPPIEERTIPPSWVPILIAVWGSSSNAFLAALRGLRRDTILIRANKVRFDGEQVTVAAEATEIQTLEASWSASEVE